MKIHFLLYLSIILALTAIVLDLLVLFLLRYKLQRLQNFVFPSTPVISDVSFQPATLFERYLKDFKKYYTGEDLTKRFEIFKNNLKEISRMNRESGARFGLTKFSDMNIEELSSGSTALTTCKEEYMSCGEGPWDGPGIDYHPNETIEEKFDWRDHHYVGPVLNQKKCNGCWAFGIVETMETKAAMKNKVFGPRRSVQEVIDCSEETSGCEGGNVVRGLRWLCSRRWGVVTENDYPLKDVTQTCKYNSIRPPVGLQLKQFWKLCRMREDLIPRLVYFHGPLIVVVNAQPWLSYIDGVIRRACIRKAGITPDHVVQIEGYDLSAQVPHYIVRNSWGEEFGMGGYVELAIGNNVCGVADEGVVLDVYKDIY